MMISIAIRSVGRRKQVDLYAPNFNVDLGLLDEPEQEQLAQSLMQTASDLLTQTHPDIANALGKLAERL